MQKQVGDILVQVDAEEGVCGTHPSSKGEIVRMIWFFTPLNLVERQRLSPGVTQLLDSPALCSPRLSMSAPILRKPEWWWGLHTEEVNQPV